MKKQIFLLVGLFSSMFVLISCDKTQIKEFKTIEISYETNSGIAQGSAVQSGLYYFEIENQFLSNNLSQGTYSVSESEIFEGTSILIEVTFSNFDDKIVSIGFLSTGENPVPPGQPGPDGIISDLINCIYGCDNSPDRDACLRVCIWTAIAAIWEQYNAGQGIDY